jgi:hypothetical protein
MFGAQHVDYFIKAKLVESALYSCNGKESKN